MAARKSTPDILNDLLGAPAPRPEDTSIPASQDTSKPARQQAGKPARRRASKPAEEPSPGEAKHKATYYLSPEAMDALDQAWLKLRKMARARAQISKSLIVEQAILLAVEELTEREGRSRLASKLVRQ